MSDADRKPDLEDTQYGSTRIITRSFEMEGIQFSWWAVDESPSLVTVSSQWFGRKSEFTNSDTEAMARKLAASILEEQQEKAEVVRAQLKEKADRRTVK